MKDLYQEVGLDPDKWEAVDASPIIPGAPAPSSLIYGESSLPLSLLTPSGQTAATKPSSRLPTIPTWPIAASGQPRINAAAQAVSEKIVAANSGLLLETGGVKNPNQGVLNLQSSSLSITADSAGNVDIEDADSGGGFNPGQVSWEEDFTSLGSGVTGITALANSGTGAVAMGNHGFFLLHPAASAPGNFVNASGAFPFVGYAAWTQTATVSQTGILYPASFGANSNTFAPQAVATWLTNLLPLFDYPGWQVSFVFRLNPYLNSSSSVAFSMAKKSLYVGLFSNNPISINSVSRPFIFFGIRFDTSTTGPSINDSFFTFEVVETLLNGAVSRVNAQGATQVTTIAPSANVIYQLDITYKTAGSITMKFSNGTTSSTFTTPVAQLGQGLGGLTAQILNGMFYVEAEAVSTSALPFVGEGSICTFANITTAGFGGLITGSPWIVKKVNENVQAPIALIEFMSPTLGNAGPSVLNSTPSNSMFTAYPGVYPGVWFGNDDTASPTANTAQIEVDKIFFQWT